MSFWSWPKINHAILNPHQLHLWWFNLPQITQDLKQQRQAILHRILNDYLPGRDLSIAKTPQGKPYLRHHRLAFNLSHSKNYMLIGIQESRALGLDLECLHPRDFNTFAQRFWGEAWCQDQFHSLANYLQMLGFYHAWTQTEAWIKYHGASVFRYPHFLPQCLPLPQARKVANDLQLLTFMPQAKVIASVCTHASIQEISLNILNLKQENDIKRFIQGV